MSLFQIAIKQKKAMNLDVIKAMRRGGREAEMELWFPLFQSSAQIKDDIYSQTEAQAGM